MSGIFLYIEVVERRSIYHYELYNHLGNVLTVITDRKLPEPTGPVGSQTVDFYTADVVAFNDYYPFGMLMPGRSDQVDGYRYGFQGQELDDEIKDGKGTSINYKYRMHDPRIGRFFAVDPLTVDYPMLTPYQFSSNSPIYLVEIEGLEGTVFLYKSWYDGNDIYHRSFVKQYTLDDLKADVNKVALKEYNKPDGETVRLTYSATSNIGTDGGFQMTWNRNDEDRPMSANDLNDLFGLQSIADNKKTEVEDGHWYDGTWADPDRSTYSYAPFESGKFELSITIQTGPKKTKYSIGISDGGGTEGGVDGFIGSSSVYDLNPANIKKVSISGFAGFVGIINKGDDSKVNITTGVKGNYGIYQGGYSTSSNGESKISGGIGFSLSLDGFSSKSKVQGSVDVKIK